MKKTQMTTEGGIIILLLAVIALQAVVLMIP